MKTRTVLLGMILTLPLLSSCSHEKAITSQQLLNAKEVQTSKKTSISQMEISESFTQNSVVYAKTKKQMRLEVLLAKEKAKAIARNPLGITVAKPAEAVVMTVKDTVVAKPIDLIIKSDTPVVTKPTFSVAQIESYMRKPSDLKKFNVVVGSFSTLEKAYVMVQSMIKAGLSPVVVPNEKGMFRVIASSQNSRDSADVDALGLELDSFQCWIWIQAKK